MKCDSDPTPRQSSAAAVTHDSGAQAGDQAGAQTLPFTDLEIICTLTAEGKWQDVTPEWFAYTGLSREQASEQEAYGAVHPDDIDALLMTFKQALAEKQPFQAVCRIRHHDGVYQPFLLRSTPVWTKDGRLRQWIATLTNIAEHEESRQHGAILQGEGDLSPTPVRAARLAQIAEERFRRLVDADLIGVVVTDQERITEANDAFLDMVGYTREDMLAGNVRWREMTPAEYAPLDERAIEEMLTRGECTPFEKEYVRKDGSRVPILIGAAILEREPLEWICFVVDLTERKRLERELAAQSSEVDAARQRLADTLETMTDAFYALDAEWRFTYLNAQAERILRHPREALIGKRLWDMFPEAVDTAFYDAFGRAMRERVPVVIEDYYAPLDLWVEIRVHPSPDGGLAAYFLDVGERKQAEAERARLLAEEQRARAKAEAATAQLQAVLDVLPVGVVIADASGRLQAVNEALRTIWGNDFPLVDGVGAYRTFRAWWAATGVPLGPEDWAMTRALSRGETSLGEELDIETFDGKRKTILHSGVPIRDEANRIIGGVTAMLDITERKRLERALADQAAELRATFDAQGDALFVYDAAGQLVRVNAAGRALLGLDTSTEYAAGHEARELGRHLELRDESDQLLPIEQWPLFRALRGETLTGPSAADVVFHSLDGHESHTSVSAAPIRDVEGKVSGAVLAIRDVTERRRLEREITERAAELEVANRRLDEFLHVVAHELRTPLTSLKANLQLVDRRLRRSVSKEPGGDESGGAPSSNVVVAAGDLLQRADQQVLRLERLLSDLTDASRAQMDKLEVYPNPCNLAALVRASVEDQRRLTKRTIHLQMPPENVPVMADAGRIEQVLTNYLTNAAKYSPTEMPIEVTLTMEGGVARVAVTDRGPGLTLEQQRRIWERFQQAEGVRAEGRAGASAGLGLGLYISKSLVERHGGAVGVESVVGNGSTFWFTLPLA